jgi:hypothetical protein
VNKSLLKYQAVLNKVQVPIHKEQTTEEMEMGNSHLIGDKILKLANNIQGRNEK